MNLVSGLRKGLLAIGMLALTYCRGVDNQQSASQQVPNTETPPGSVEVVLEATATSVSEDSTSLVATPGESGNQSLVTVCPEDEGRIERVQYSSQLIGEYIPVLVYLPPCHSDQRRYPQIFLLHGKPQDENHWLILGIEKVIQNGIRSGEIPELILVMPEQPEPLFTRTDGGAGSYEGEFMNALLPFIEDKYPVSSRPTERAIAGISRGGVWALEIAFRNPEVFGAVGGLSPALNVNDARSMYDPIVLAGSPDGLPERIFLASGDVDSAADKTRQLHEILAEQRIDHRYTTVPGGHEGATWQQLLGELVAYLSGDW